MLRWIAILAVFSALFVTPMIALGAQPPDLSEVLHAARAAQGTDEAPDRWSSRSRWRGLMPRVSASLFGKESSDLDLTFREYVGTTAEGRLLLDSTQNTFEDDVSDEFGWRVTATWDFGELIFSNAELAAAREERARRAMRIRLDLETMQAFRTWRDATDPAALQAAVDHLDVLTDGWFSRRTGGRR